MIFTAANIHFSCEITKQKLHFSEIWTINLLKNARYKQECQPCIYLLYMQSWLILKI